MILQFSTLQFFDMPLALATVETFPVEHWVSANTLSFLGVLVCILAFYLLASESLHLRQMGFWAFRVREYIDSLDGYVGRSTRGETKYAVDYVSIGSYVDRIADGIGYGLVCLGMIKYLSRSRRSKDMTLVPVKVPGSPIRKRFYQETEAGILVTVQILYASTLWNYFTIVLSQIFETTTYVNTEAKLEELGVLYRAVPTCMLFYFWRTLCHQGLTHFWLLAVIYDKSLEFVDVLKYVGFTGVTVVSVVSFLYTQYLIHRLAVA